MAQGNAWKHFDDEAEAVSKAFGVKPVLARRVGAAGRGGRRNLTGDRVNLRRVIGKAAKLRVVRDGERAPRGQLDVKSTATGATAGGGVAYGYDRLSGGYDSRKRYRARRARDIERSKAEVGKRRDYDPDAARSARTGAAAGVTGVAGAGLFANGAREIYVEGGARRPRPFDPGPAPQRPNTRAGETTRTNAPTGNGKPRTLMSVDEVKAVQRRAEREAAEHRMAVARHADAREASEVINRLRQSRGRYVSGRGAAQVVGGAALLGGAAGLHRKAKEAPYR